MSPSDRLRLFVAASLPQAHLESVAATTVGLRERWPQARWTDPANQHVTLKFLGWTSSDLFDEVVEVVGSVADRHGPATLRLGGLGVFPSRSRARVLWIGLEDPAGVLASLARDLDEGFEPLGFSTEKRPFRSHLTLARFRQPERITEELPEIDLRDLPAFEVTAVDLFRSHLHPKGARYEVVGSFALSGDRGEPVT